MAETSRGRSRPEEDSKIDSMMDWFQVNSKQALIGLAAVAIVVAGWWFYSRSETLKAQKAERAYFQALQSVASGNTPLAISDLRKMTTRYAGARAAVQGTIALAQLLYEQGKFAEGLAELNKLDDGDARKAFMGSALHRMKAAGLEHLGKFLDAAAEYGKSAEAASFPAERALYRGDQARALMTAGKKDEARAIWTDLAKDDKSAIAAEARVRLGELTAVPVPKS